MTQTFNYENHLNYTKKNLHHSNEFILYYLDSQWHLKRLRNECFKLF